MSLSDAARTTWRSSTLLGYAAATIAGFEVQSRDLDEAAREVLLDRYRRGFCTRMLRLFDVRVEWQDEPPAPQAHGRLIVANHRSVVDIPVLVGKLGGELLSRDDVADWPLLGGLARRANTIFVDRTSRRSGAAAIRAMRDRLAAGATVIVFPEGGTHRGDVVRPFRLGAFAAARGLDVEVLPVGIAHEPGAEYVDMTFTRHLREVAARPRARVVAQVGTPLMAGSDTPALAQAAHDQVQSLLDRARAAMG